MNLAAVQQFSIPAAVVADTERAIRRAGSEGYELFVLWTGIYSDAGFAVRTAHVPKQTSYRLETGLCVRVDGDELHRLNLWQFEHNEVLGVQIHSHPTTAYHSDTDDAYPMVTQVGGLSIVLPDFGTAGLGGPGVAIYRLATSGWQRLGDRTAQELVVVN